MFINANSYNKLLKCLCHLLLNAFSGFAINISRKDMHSILYQRSSPKDDRRIIIRNVQISHVEYLY